MKFSATIILTLTLGLLQIESSAIAATNEPAAEKSFIQPAINPNLPTLFLIGDSTVKNGHDKGDGGLWGWGNPIAAYFDRTKINVQNRALGGTSSRSFQTGGLWEPVLADIKPGDFVIMQFGHNDGGGALDDVRARSTIRGNGDDAQEVTLKTGKKEIVHTYGWYMRKYISDTKSKGATPIVCSLIPRNDWTDGKVHRAASGYGKWAAEAAKARGAYFIDLNGLIADRYDQIGQEKVTAEFFVSEHTHTSMAGARVNAECVIAGIKGLKDCPLAGYILDMPN